MIVCLLATTHQSCILLTHLKLFVSCRTSLHTYWLYYFRSWINCVDFINIIN